MGRSILFVLSILMLSASASSTEDYRWQGHDFVFCFVTDDGSRSNIGWAQTATEMGFQFTATVNCGNGDSNPNYLTGAEAHQLFLDGVEIGQHGYSHGFNGLPSSCPSPPRGSLMGYLLCTDLEPILRAQYLAIEIDRDSIAAWGSLPAADIRVVAYPRHRHGQLLIDELICKGFIGARTGGRFNYASNSYGDFQVQARNSWDGGISLFRVPTYTDDKSYFGNHSASPPVHKTYEEFAAVAQPIIDAFRVSGGMMVLFTHHFGDDDDTWGDNNYGAGGVNSQDLAWIVDLVRSNNGVVMSFGDAVAYYRSRSYRVDIDGDYVWMTGPSGVDDTPSRVPFALTSYPNPFNPNTRISYSLETAGQVRVTILDSSGALINCLVDQNLGAGEHFVNWNGRSRDGRMVAAGSYLVHVVSEGVEATRKITLLK